MATWQFNADIDISHMRRLTYSLSAAKGQQDFFNPVRVRASVVSDVISPFSSAPREYLVVPLGDANRPKSR